MTCSAAVPAQRARTTTWLILLLGGTATADAQERLAPTIGIAATPTFQSWTFGRGMRQDGVDVQSARQLAVPLSVQFPLGNRVQIDASGAFVQATVEGTDSAGATRSAQITGPTDVRVRALITVGGGLALTAGINLPLGATELNAEQLLTVRTLGAPSLRATVPTIGMGFGSTVGLVYARRVGAWAVGSAVSAEQRAGYTPFEAALTGLQSELRPGNALHLSLGADGFAGESRVGVVSGLDLFSDDRVDVSSAGLPAFSTTYRLGPQLFSGINLDLATQRARAVRLSVAHRWRARFIGPDKQQVPGSAAHFFDGAADAVFGKPAGIGFLIGLDARYASKLDLDPSFVTAGVSGFGAKLGLTSRRGGATWETGARMFRGQLTQRVSSASMTMLLLTASVSR